MSLQATDKQIYLSSHVMQVSEQHGKKQERTIAVSVVEKKSKNLEIRVCDVNDYSFLYIKVIDARVFQEMKCQQSLNVDYHDFQEQLLELFDKIKSQEMLIGLEQCGGECKMVFYEKAKLKSLIFLTIDLDEMDRLEAINELAATVEDLKIRNKEKNEQLQAAYLEIDGLAKCVKTLEAKFTHVHQQFVEYADSLQSVMSSKMREMLNTVLNKISRETDRIDKLHSKMDILKIHDQQRCESSTRLVESMQNLRLETEQSYHTIETLEADLDITKELLRQQERTCANLKSEAAVKDDTISRLQANIEDLQNKLEKSEMKVEAKQKANIAIAKEVMCANEILAKYNRHYDEIAKDNERLERAIEVRDSIMTEQTLKFRKLTEDYVKYKTEFGVEKFNLLNKNLTVANEKIRELESKNRELSKLNAVLTKKISGDCYDK